MNGLVKNNQIVFSSLKRKVSGRYGKSYAYKKNQ